MIIPPPADLAGRYRVTNGARFRLKDVDPADPWGKRLKPISGQILKQGHKQIANLQTVCPDGVLERRNVTPLCRPAKQAAVCA